MIAPQGYRSRMAIRRKRQWHCHEGMRKRFARMSRAERLESALRMDEFRREAHRLGVHRPVRRS